MRPGRALLIGCVVVVVAAVLGTLVALGGSPSGRVVHSSSPVAEGVHPVIVDGVGIVVDRQGDEIRAFVGQDLRRDALQWCPNVEMFTTLNWGSLFTRDGRKVSGPAPGDLVAVPVQLGDDGRVEVDLARVDWPAGDGTGRPVLPTIGEGWIESFANPWYCPPHPLGADG